MVSLRAGKHAVTVTPKVEDGTSSTGAPVLVDGTPVVCRGNMHSPSSTSLSTGSGDLLMSTRRMFSGRGTWPGSPYSDVRYEGVLWRQDGEANVFNLGNGTKHYEVALVEPGWTSG